MGLRSLNKRFKEFWKTKWMYWFLFLKWNRVEILTCSYLYLSEVLRLKLKTSFSSLHSSIQDTEIFDDLNSLVTCSDVSDYRFFHGIMLCQLDICFEKLKIKWKMSETFIINLSQRCADWSGERTECVVAVDIISFVGWLTLQLNGFRARENIHEKKFKHSSLRDSSISCDSRKIHCLTREFHVKFHSIKWDRTHRYSIRIVFDSVVKLHFASVLATIRGSQSLIKVG